MEKRFDEGDALLPVQLTDHVFGNEKRDGCHYAKSEADPDMQYPHVLTDGGVSLGRSRPRLQDFPPGCGLQIVNRVARPWPAPNERGLWLFVAGAAGNRA